MYVLSKGPNGDFSNRSFPKYAGFERDVFKAIVEFFDDEDKGPLVPRHLLRVFQKTVGKKLCRHVNLSTTSTLRPDDLYPGEVNR